MIFEMCKTQTGEIIFSILHLDLIWLQQDSKLHI